MPGKSDADREKRSVLLMRVGVRISRYSCWRSVPSLSVRPLRAPRLQCHRLVREVLSHPTL